MIEFPERHCGGFILSTDKSKIQEEVVHHFLDKDSYWSQGIPLSTLSTAIAHSLCLGAYLKDGNQVGFGRMITDYATFGYLADVFVLKDHRGKGVSKAMMEYFCAIADQCGLRRFLLTTQDAHGLYSQYGFEPFPYPERLMSRKGKTHKVLKTL
jgi:GNAT superfamily N-acetyltransferase